jgi:hypothetical protein
MATTIGERLVNGMISNLAPEGGGPSSLLQTALVQRFDDMHDAGFFNSTQLASVLLATPGFKDLFNDSGIDTNGLSGLQAVGGFVDDVMNLIYHVFDDTITVTDLGTYEAGDGNFLFVLDTAESMKFANINEFGIGDAVSVQTGNELTVINPDDPNLEMLYGQIGGASGAWLLTFTGLAPGLIEDLEAVPAFTDQVIVLDNAWNHPANEWYQGEIFHDAFQGFDETITVNDLGSYEAGDGNYLFLFETAGAMKFANIIDFGAGDAVSVQTGNGLTLVNPEDPGIEMVFGEIGGPSGAWFVSFSQVDDDLLENLAAQTTLEDQIAVLGSAWNQGSNEWFQLA